MFKLKASVKKAKMSFRGILIIKMRLSYILLIIGKTVINLQFLYTLHFWNDKFCEDCVLLQFTFSLNGTHFSMKLRYLNKWAYLFLIVVGTFSAPSNGSMPRLSESSESDSRILGLFLCLDLATCNDSDPELKKVLELIYMMLDT